MNSFHQPTHSCSFLPKPWFREYGITTIIKITIKTYHQWSLLLQVVLLPRCHTTRTQTPGSVFQGWGSPTVCWSHPQAPASPQTPQSTETSSEHDIASPFLERASTTPWSWCRSHHWLSSLSVSPILQAKQKTDFNIQKFWEMLESGCCGVVDKAHDQSGSLLVWAMQEMVDCHCNNCTVALDRMTTCSQKKDLY